MAFLLMLVVLLLVPIFLATSLFGGCKVLAAACFLCAAFQFLLMLLMLMLMLMLLLIVMLMLMLRRRRRRRRLLMLMLLVLLLVLLLVFFQYAVEAGVEAAALSSAAHLPVVVVPQLWAVVASVTPVA